MRRIIYGLIGCLVGACFVLPVHAQHLSTPVKARDSLHVVSSEQINDQRLANYLKLLSSGSEHREKSENRFMVMPVVGYHPSQITYGLMIGLFKRTGGYIKVKHSFTQASDDHFSCDDEGFLKGTDQKLWYSGRTAKSRMAVTGGVVQQVFKSLYFHAGLGYGSRSYSWETVDSQWVKNKDHSYEGVEVELGALICTGPLVFSLGAQTNSFQYLEGNIGIGILF